MARYVVQPDLISCGPTAILNVLKWAGKDVTLEDLPFLIFGCRTIDPASPRDSDQNGTFDPDFDRVLRYVGRGLFKVRRRKYPSFTSIRLHLESGGVVALAYHWKTPKDSGEHFCLIAGLERGCFVSVNDEDAFVRGAAQSRRRPSTVRRWLARHPSRDCPTAWFVSLVSA